jgi:hypothetical protein
MRRKGLSVALLGALVIALAVSCSKSTEPNGNGDAPAWEGDTIGVPAAMANSQDPQAQMAMAWINMANAIGGFTGMFEPPEQATISPSIQGIQDETWEYSWTNNGLTVTLTITETSDRYTWEVKYDGTDGTYVYDNWVFIEAEGMKDASSMWLKVYEPVTTLLSSEWVWTYDGSTVECVFTSYYQGIPQMKVEITSNSDLSGEINVYEYVGTSWLLDWRAVWAADGSGQWWDYEAGVLVNQGTWG